MKKSLILLYVFASIILVSCKTKSALNYNQEIIRLETSLVPAMEKTEKDVTTYFETENYDSAAAVSLRMEALVDAKLKEVEALKAPDVKEASTLKQAAIRYFAYMKSIYTSYKSFAQATTEESREAEREKLLKVVDEKNDALREIQTAQKKFASANGFKIQ
jgi:hypothetical protein